MKISMHRCTTGENKPKEKKHKNRWRGRFQYHGGYYLFFLWQDDNIDYTPVDVSEYEATILA